MLFVALRLQLIGTGWRRRRRRIFVEIDIAESEIGVTRWRRRGSAGIEQRIHVVVLSLSPQIVLERATERRVHSVRMRLTRVSRSHGTLHSVRREQGRFRSVRIVQRRSRGPRFAVPGHLGALQIGIERVPALQPSRWTPSGIAVHDRRAVHHGRSGGSEAVGWMQHLARSGHRWDRTEHARVVGAAEYRLHRVRFADAHCCRFVLNHFAAVAHRVAVNRLLTSLHEMDCINRQLLRWTRQYHTLP